MHEQYDWRHQEARFSLKWVFEQIVFLFSPFVCCKLHYPPAPPNGVWNEPLSSGSTCRYRVRDLHLRDFCKFGFVLVSLLGIMEFRNFWCACCCGLSFINAGQVLTGISTGGLCFCCSFPTRSNKSFGISTFLYFYLLLKIGFVNPCLVAACAHFIWILLLRFS